MAIRMRRGLESELDISKAVPGEWLVSTDTRYVRMCFAPGIVLRMATYEAFEADTQKFIEQMEQILSETKTVQEAVERIQNEIEDSVITVENYVESAKGYSNLSNTYAMQSKRYAEDANDYADDAYEEAERAKMYADIAETVTNVNIATKDTAGIIKGGENHIAEDGTLTLTARTTDSALLNSHAGGLAIDWIAGAVEQNGTPTPDAHIEIKNAEIGEIKTHNKNFIPYPFPYYGEGTKTLHGVTFTANKGTVTISGAIKGSDEFAYRLIGISNSIKFPAGTYTISGHPGNDTRYHIRVYSVVNGDTTRIATDTGSGATFTLKVETALQIVINILSGAIGTTFNNVVVKPQLELGEKITEWELYTASTVAFAFNGRAIEVSADYYYTYEKDGKYYVADSIERVDGGYQKIQRVRRFIFDGSENWTTNKTITGNVRFFMEDNTVPSASDLGRSIWSKLMMCSHMQPCTSSSTQPYRDGETIAIHDTQHMFQLYTPKYQDLDSWKAYLAEQYANGTPFTVDVIMPTPIITPLTDEEVIALLSMKSFDEITHVTTDSTLKPIISAEYGTSHVGAIALDAWNTAKRNEIKNAKLVELTNSIATALV